MLDLLKIPPAVAAKLGHYVYLYVNPLDDQVFYVGKGKGSRALAHLDDEGKDRVQEVLRTIEAAGREPRIEILSHGLPSPEAALQVEAAAIDLLGLGKLANKVSGWRSRDFGRMGLSDLVAHYTRRQADITEPAILIRINQKYRHGMSPTELYDATRSAWKVGSTVDKVRLAFAIYHSVVREVYAVSGWHPGGSTFNTYHSGQRAPREDRLEFVGTLADEDTRKRYLHGYVGHLFPPGAQNPITYVNVE